MFSISGSRQSGSSGAGLASEMFESVNGTRSVDGEFVLDKFIVFILEELADCIEEFFDERDWSLVSTSVAVSINKFKKKIIIKNK